MFKTEKIPHDFDNVFDFLLVTSEDNCEINYLKYSDKTEYFLKEEYEKLNFLEKFGFVNSFEDFKSKLFFIIPNSINSNYVYRLSSKFITTDHIILPPKLLFNVKIKTDYSEFLKFNYKIPSIIFYNNHLAFDFFNLDHNKLELFINNSRKFPDNLLDYNGNKLSDNCPFIIEEYDNVYLIEHYYVYKDCIYVSNKELRGDYNKWSTGENFGRRINFDDIIKFKMKSLTPTEYAIFKLKE